MDESPESPWRDDEQEEPSDANLYHMPLPFGVFVVIVFNGLLLLSVPELLKSTNVDPGATIYWTMLWLRTLAGLATIVCIMPRHPRWLRMAAIFQRWTAVAQLIAFAVFFAKPPDDGDQLTFILLFPGTVLVVLGLGASAYLNRVAARLVD
ncbi:MAG TPA: hypothetical protein VGK19_15220 [Capsulimonadaceae bacterium]|jgi:hypothetical protein